MEKDRAFGEQEPADSARVLDDSLPSAPAYRHRLALEERVHVPVPHQPPLVDERDNLDPLAGGPDAADLTLRFCPCAAVVGQLLVGVGGAELSIDHGESSASYPLERRPRGDSAAGAGKDVDRGVRFEPR